MYFTVIIVSFLSLVSLSLQTPFTDVLSSQQNLSSFSETLTKYYPDLLTFIGQQTSDNPITILAPSNAAFAKTVYYPIIGPAFSNNDIGAIQAILQYHIIIGNHRSTSLLSTFQYFPTWLTNTTYTNVTGGQRVGGVFQNSKEMIWSSGLSSRSTVLTPDISFDGGTIHIIDTLLTPPTSFPQTAELFSTAAEPYQITSFLGATYSLSNDTLAKMLNKTSDLTIFVPNNVAMEIVSSSLLSLASQNSSINVFEQLLKYHIIVANGGPIYSPSFPQNTSSTLVLPTLAGPDIAITFQPNSYFVDSARVLATDLLLGNGVMHVLDNVLNPSSTEGKPDPALATQTPVLNTGAVGGFNASEAPFTSNLPNAIVTKAPAAVTGQTYGVGGGRTSTGVPEATGVGGSSSNKSGGVRESVGRVWMMSCLLTLAGLAAHFVFW